MQLRPGRLTAIVIVTGWAALLGTHLLRSYAGTADDAPSDLGTPSGPGLTQRGVFYRGARIGYVRETLSELPSGVHTEQEGVFTLNVMGQERKMKISGGADVDRSGRLLRFSFRLSTASGRSPFETEVKGTVRGTDLDLTIRSGGSERHDRRELAEPPSLPLNLYRSLAARGFEVGRRFRVPLLDPLTLSQGEAEVAVMDLEVVRWGGHEEEAFRLSNRFSGLSTSAWVTASGEVLKEETALGWTLLKEAPDSALTVQSGRAPDVVAASAIPARGWSGDPASLSRTRLRLHRFPADWSGIDGNRQKYRRASAELAIERESFPIESPSALAPAELKEALASDSFIQAEDPQIRALAESLTRGASPVEAARALSFWVYENLRKTVTLSIPSAREVLEQRAGDCNEHTVLFTALARSVDLPTRMCTGLAWSGGQFYYHAWPEVFLGRWVAVDPTFGQFPADALHVRLLTGGLDRQYEVLNLMGRAATIEILEAR